MIHAIDETDRWIVQTFPKKAIAAIGHCCDMARDSQIQDPTKNRQR